MELQTIIFALLFLIGIVFLTGYLGLKLVEAEPSDVRLIWYVFSLSLVITLLLAEWAAHAGAIDTQGAFHGEHGALLQKLLSIMLDFDLDMAIFGSLVVLILLPQVLSYVLSGLFGGASAPIFVGKTIDVFAFLIAKMFITGAGILVAVAIYGLWASWQGWGMKDVGPLLAMAMLLIFLTFAVVFLLRDGQGKITPSKALRIQCIEEMFVSVRRWMTRNIKSRR